MDHQVVRKSAKTQNTPTYVSKDSGIHGRHGDFVLRHAAVVHDPGCVLVRMEKIVMGTKLIPKVVRIKFVQNGQTGPYTLTVLPLARLVLKRDFGIV